MALNAALGARITGVDDKTFSSTGEAFSAISTLALFQRIPALVLDLSSPLTVLPKAETTVTKQLQADDVSL